MKRGITSRWFQFWLMIILLHHGLNIWLDLYFERLDDFLGFPSIYIIYGWLILVLAPMVFPACTRYTGLAIASAIIEIVLNLVRLGGLIFIIVQDYSIPQVLHLYFYSNLVLFALAMVVTIGYLIQLAQWNHKEKGIHKANNQSRPHSAPVHRTTKLKNVERNVEKNRGKNVEKNEPSNLSAKREVPSKQTPEKHSKRMYVDNFLIHTNPIPHSSNSTPSPSNVEQTQNRLKNFSTHQAGASMKLSHPFNTPNKSNDLIHKLYVLSTLQEQGLVTKQEVSLMKKNILTQFAKE